MTEPAAPHASARPARASLTRDDWLAVARAALLAEGQGGVRVEALARALTATKGSFYWHFRDLADLSRALVAEMEARLAALDAAAASIPPRKRVMALTLDPDASGEGAALRDWALRDAEAKAAVARLDGARLALLTTALEETGLGAAAAARGARILLAARIGIGRLSDAAEDINERTLRHLARVVLDGGL
jgi:AcrR family transcriptional regulator